MQRNYTASINGLLELKIKKIAIDIQCHTTTPLRINKSLIFAFKFKANLSN